MSWFSFACGLNVCAGWFLGSGDYAIAFAFFVFSVLALVNDIRGMK